MAIKTWTLADQAGFAALSGDYNPIHVDPVYARRCLFGKAVVHGIHLVLWALDQYCVQIGKPLRLDKVKAVFQKPVGLGDKTELSIEELGSKVKLRLVREAVGLTHISFEVDADGFPSGRPKELQKIFVPQAPENVSPQEMTGKKGGLEMKVDFDAVKRLFPSLWRSVPVEQIAFLVTTSRLVGMHCPGLYSVYHELDADFIHQDQSQPMLHYEVKSYHEVFHLAAIQVTSSEASAVIKAFVRPPFNELKKAAEIQSHVTKNEFAGQKALIIGGSRGLGALSAKILAVGGADVYITFSQGQKDAVELKQELEACGCVIRYGEFDVLNQDKNIVEILPEDWKPTHLYYFATPFIAQGVQKCFSQDLFDRFCQFYVSGFWRVAAQVLSFQGLKLIVSPSSAFVDELPPNMLEYVAAKCAGEGMAAYVQKNFAGIKVLIPRLERMATDQTASLLPSENKDPLPVMLDLLRSGKLAIAAKEKDANPTPS